MMAFTCNDIPRFAFGFYNPNHAAAMICAVMASRWGNRTSRVTCDRAGVTVSREDRSYDKYGEVEVRGLRLSCFALSGPMMLIEGMQDKQ